MSYKYGSSLFLGETLGGQPNPVFFDIHTPIANNSPATALITGASGSGKSYMFMDLVALSAVLGKACVVLDPKGDSLGINLIAKDLGNLKFWNLSGRGQSGILDPFQMPIDDESNRLELILSSIEMFTGGISDDQRTILGAIVQDVMQEQVPSLLRVVEVMTMHREQIVRNLGSRLSLISKMKFAKLCFAPGRKGFSPIDLNNGVTIVTMPGMNLPTDMNHELNNQERIASTIFFLITSMINGMLYSADRTVRKVLFIDEAWAVLSTEPGVKVVKSVSLLGRAKNMALVLATQNSSHLDVVDIDNSISTRFAFRTDYKEASAIARAMNLPTGQGFEQILVNLKQGQCLMEENTEGRSRYATMTAVVTSPKWHDAFQTNPMERMKRDKKLREQKGM